MSSIHSHNLTVVVHPVIIEVPRYRLDENDEPLIAQAVCISNPQTSRCVSSIVESFG